MNASYMAVPGMRPGATIMEFKDFDHITKVVCGITGQEPSRLHIRTRKREIVWTRQLCMTLGKLKTRNSLQSVGDYYGGFDHATVLHAMKTVKNLIETDKVIRQDVGHLFNGVVWPNFKN